MVEQSKVKLRAVAGHGDMRAFRPYFVYRFYESSLERFPRLWTTTNRSFI
ncbi:hypothetical protein SPRA44_310029 [Serratia proteamaculans]|nr:hypothetical protein SPRA44_310029 [Serratia proteamaculans]